MFRSERGATLYEATILITAMATMTAVAAPVGGAMMDRARIVTARQQISSLASAMDLLLADQYGRLPLEGARLLVSDGNAPGPTSSAWAASIDGTEVLPLAGILYENDYDLAVPAGPLDFGWRGPYMQRDLGPDPWGNRYAVTVSSDGPMLILSAGPDGTVRTSPDGGVADRSVSDDLVFLIDS